VRVVGDMAVLDTRLRPTQTTTLNQRFQLRDKGDHIQLFFNDESSTEFGFLRSNMTKVLSKLLDSHTLYFEAVVGTDNLRETIGRVSKPSEALIRANIHIYGPPSEADSVGLQLSSHKLWLQKPDQAIRDIPYENPQFLEFEGLDIGLLENPAEIIERNRPRQRTEEDHLRQTMAEVYNSSKRQEGLTQVNVHGGLKTEMLEYVARQGRTKLIS
jgi:SWI/SNF-related matrix-associated actin-dependent regulator of chromatin subfamily A3